MTIVTQMMLIFLIVCAIAVCLTRNLLTSVIIYMGYSMIMSIIWITLESPGSGDHGGGGRRGHHQPAVLPDPQEDSRHRRAQRSAPRP